MALKMKDDVLDFRTLYTTKLSTVKEMALKTKDDVLDFRTLYNQTFLFIEILESLLFKTYWNRSIS